MNQLTQLKIESKPEFSYFRIEQTEKRYYESEDKLLLDPETRGNLSYWKNPGSESLKNSTLSELLTECAEKYGDRHAICVHQGSRLTYKQVLNQVRIYDYNC